MKKKHTLQLIGRAAAWSLCSVLVVACKGKADSRDRQKAVQQPPAINPAPYKKPPSTYSDTLVIQPGTAVFYNPDSLQLAKIKAVRAKDQFETEEHYCVYQMHNALLLLQKSWPQIHILETAMARYLLFVKRDKSQTCIDLDGAGDMCGVYLFDGKKEPEPADMMNFDTSLKFYFGD